MLNFIQVSFCFLLFLGLGLGLGIDNLKNIWRCKHVGHSLSLDACIAGTTDDLSGTREQTRGLGGVSK